MGESSASSDSLDDIATARSLSPPFSTAGEPEPPPGAGARPRAPPRCKKRPAPAPPPALVRQSVDSPVSGSGSHHARNLAQALVLADEDARSDISAAA
ncbi:unnamed protein product [Notodromas monacha]|uniref:Uncharacterized protein n=1 Tax=Notodromas monacha TaxID=399045 RepID=A0A7R9BXE9_9CRUS|nr:unnamed protein product [Notodromas monacha]CAG0922583.1 unnamed protein product [Notodromas monacha]